MSQELTAAEAAARLGVKRATLYAYVSRGLLQRHLALDGRTSRFDADEIDAFRSGRRRATEGELDTVISTSLTRVRDGDLRLRGQDLVALVAEGRDFEAVADLVLGGAGGWTVSASTLEAVRRAQGALPEVSAPLERLRVTTAVLSALDPLRFDPAPAAVRRAGRSLLVAMVEGLPARGREPKRGRLADRLWPRLTAKRGSAEQRAALNAALALLVDHGLAASTFGARIAASVRADPYSIVSAGLGVLGGTLHGAASRAVVELLRAAHGTEDAGVAVGEAQRRHGHNPGFGHKVYRREDPRYGALMARVSDAWRDDPRLATVHAVRDLISERTDALPNIDLALGAFLWLAGMDVNAGEAIFAIARSAGWLAHGLEEFREKPLRFRPRARFVEPRPDTVARDHPDQELGWHA